MAQARRGHGDDSIYFDAANSTWIGAVSLGRGPDGKRARRTVRGKTKTAVRRKLRELREEIAAGARTSARYTVSKALNDWLDEGLDGRSDATVKLYQDMAKPLHAAIGGVPLKDLSAHDVRTVLAKLAEDHSTRSVQIAHNCLVRAITHAQVGDYVVKNVAALVKSPAGQTGRPSKALTADQAAALLDAAKGTRMHAYVVLCLQTGIRTEEARALTWSHIDLDEGTVAVWRSVRAHADTKTQKSRRTLRLPALAAQALREHRQQQLEDRLKAGDQWVDNDLVFASSVGTPLDRHNVLRSFRTVTRTAGLGDDWTPRELRHSFVSVMSANGVAVEEIARLAGHASTVTTERVYRRELRPVISTGAEVMDRIFRPAAEA